MSRGNQKEVGSRFTNANGYTYEKTEDRRWVAVHLLIAEQFLGRKLHVEERVFFVDGDRKNLNPENIRVKVVYDKKTAQGKLVIVQAKIDDLKDQLSELEETKIQLLAEIATAVV